MSDCPPDCERDHFPCSRERWVENLAAGTPLLIRREGHEDVRVIVTEVKGSVITCRGVNVPPFEEWSL